MFSKKIPFKKNYRSKKCSLFPIFCSEFQKNFPFVLKNVCVFKMCSYFKKCSEFFKIFGDKKSQELQILFTFLKDVLELRKLLVCSKNIQPFKIVHNFQDVSKKFQFSILQCVLKYFTLPINHQKPPIPVACDQQCEFDSLAGVLLFRDFYVTRYKTLLASPLALTRSNTTTKRRNSGHLDKDRVGTHGPRYHGVSSAIHTQRISTPAYVKHVVIFFSRKKDMVTGMTLASNTQYLCYRMIKRRRENKRRNLRPVDAVTMPFQRMCYRY